MMRYTIIHKFCGMTTTIEGYTVWDAFRSYNKDSKMWKIISVEEM